MAKDKQAELEGENNALLELTLDWIKRFEEQERLLNEALETLELVTNHLADMMTGPIMSQFIELKNGVDGIPTIKKARAILSKRIEHH